MGKSRAQRKKEKVTLAKTTAAKLTTSEIVNVQVSDPFEPEKNLSVAKNIRVHPLDQMSARGRISEAQKSAGDRFLAIYDRSQIGGAKAIDYSTVKVDVSFSYDGLDEDAMKATDMLKEICLDVGKRSYGLLVKIIGHRLGLFDLARRLDGTVDRDHAEHLSKSLKEALDDLDDYFGVAEGKPAPRAPYRRVIPELHGKIDLASMGRLTTPALRATK